MNNLILRQHCRGKTKQGHLHGKFLKHGVQLFKICLFYVAPISDDGRPIVYCLDGGIGYMYIPHRWWACIPSWQPLLCHFRVSHQTFGIHCQAIFRLFQLFLLFEEVSNTIFYCVLILTIGHHGSITPSERITLCDRYNTSYCHRTARKYHVVQLNVCVPFWTPTISHTATVIQPT